MAVAEQTGARGVRIARAGFAAVVLASGVSGLALLARPDATDRFFSWGLAPPPLASLIGGFYVASAVTFWTALRLPWRGVRSLVAASVALSVPTLLATLAHLDVFDFGRWQAWAWVMLFSAAPPFWAGLLIANRSRARTSSQTRARPAAAAGLLALAVVFGLLALLLWIDPAAGARVVPFEPSLLGGRFLGSWMAFLAVMVSWVALRPAEAGLCLVALTAYPAGAFLAGLRTFADLSPLASRWVYLVVVAGMSLAFGTALVRTRFPRTGAVEPSPR